jgi:hypothetical protein
LKRVPLDVGLRPTPEAVTVGAVANAAPSITTIVPAVALARDAEAPEMVVALPTVGVMLYCRVEAVVLLSVIHSDHKEVIRTSPTAVKTVSAFTITLALVDAICPEFCGAPAALILTETDIFKSPRTA